MLIKAENIKKTFFEGVYSEELIVLNGLDFQMEHGSVVCITGLSGSGKSTLLYLLGTLDKPDRGEIYFNEKNINQFSEIELANFRNRNIGFVFQAHHLLPELTTLENVAMPMMIAGNSYVKSKKIAEYILQQLNMQNRKFHYPNQLSGGEQQRVAVARALINNPEIILADEPTGNLDQHHSEMLLEILFDLNKTFSTLLMVTHNENIARKSEIVYKLSQGKLRKI